jgi:hypothetical protein
MGWGEGTTVRAKIPLHPHGLAALRVPLVSAVLEDWTATVGTFWLGKTENR